MEIWKLYKPGYIAYQNNGGKREIPPIYISNLGNIKGRSVIIRSSDKSCGYLSFRYKGKNYSIHRAVAELFIPNPDNKPQVDHINTIRTDNRAENLRWVTCQENTWKNEKTLEKRKESILKGKLEKKWTRLGGENPNAKTVHDNISGITFSTIREYANYIEKPITTVRHWFERSKFPSGFSAVYVKGGNHECMARY